MRKRLSCPTVPVVCFPLPVDPSCAYAPATLPVPAKWDDRITFAGGINAPKVVRFFVSSGVVVKMIAALKFQRG